MASHEEFKSERGISLVLRWGSLASALIMATGVSIMLVRGPGAAAGASDGIKLRLLLSRLARFDLLAITELGVLLLLLTPIFRIVMAIVGFARERDHKYVVVSVGVLVIVLFSIGYAVVG